ncbi:EAL domain-containing protein [Lacticaseibacillus baoqingensis]|uniref:EAL domain-containing protein n=1 Tax=Lacticaseibacillus baoqingensis TaxID=2486013 RepID=UPI0013DE38B3|nr:EAL domain-containing protein [Lacticaseibacillus baoqingensis]
MRAINKETKVRFKLYKDGKNWVAAGIATAVILPVALFSATLLAPPASVRATSSDAGYVYKGSSDAQVVAQVMQGIANGTVYDATPTGSSSVLVEQQDIATLAAAHLHLTLNGDRWTISAAKDATKADLNTVLSQVGFPSAAALQNPTAPANMQAILNFVAASGILSVNGGTTDHPGAVKTSWMNNSLISGDDFSMGTTGTLNQSNKPVGSTGYGAVISGILTVPSADNAPMPASKILLTDSGYITGQTNIPNTVLDEAKAGGFTFSDGSMADSLRALKTAVTTIDNSFGSATAAATQDQYNSYIYNLDFKTATRDANGNYVFTLDSSKLNATTQYSLNFTNKDAYQGGNVVIHVTGGNEVNLSRMTHFGSDNTGFLTNGSKLVLSVPNGNTVDVSDVDGVADAGSLVLLAPQSDIITTVGGYAGFVGAINGDGSGNGYVVPSDPNNPVNIPTGGGKTPPATDTNTGKTPPTNTGDTPTGDHTTNQPQTKKVIATQTIHYTYGDGVTGNAADLPKDTTETTTITDDGQGHIKVDTPFKIAVKTQAIKVTAANGDVTTYSGTADNRGWDEQTLITQAKAVPDGDALHHTITVTYYPSTSTKHKTLTVTDVVDYDFADGSSGDPHLLPTDYNRNVTVSYVETTDSQGDVSYSDWQITKGIDKLVVPTVSGYVAKADDDIDDAGILAMLQANGPAIPTLFTDVDYAMVAVGGLQGSGSGVPDPVFEPTGEVGGLQGSGSGVPDPVFEPTGEVGGVQGSGSGVPDPVFEPTGEVGGVQGSGSGVPDPVFEPTGEVGGLQGSGSGVPDPVFEPTGEVGGVQGSGSGVPDPVFEPTGEVGGVQGSGSGVPDPVFEPTGEVGGVQGSGSGVPDPVFEPTGEVGGVQGSGSGVPDPVFEPTGEVGGVQGSGSGVPDPVFEPTGEVGGVQGSGSGVPDPVFEPTGEVGDGVQSWTISEVPDDAPHVTPSDGQTTPPSDGQTTPPSDGQTTPPSNGQTPPPSDGQTTPPSDGQTTPPSDGQTTPPSDGQTTPPSDGQTTPPSNGQTTPPSDGQTTPPSDGQTTPPSDGQTTPPSDGQTTPPSNGQTTPPSNGQTTPPSDGQTTPPSDGQTTPPSDGQTTPPSGGQTTPPSDGQTTPPSDGQTTPPSDGQTTPPSDGQTTPPTANVTTPPTTGTTTPLTGNATPTPTPAAPASAAPTTPAGQVTPNVATPQQGVVAPPLQSQTITMVDATQAPTAAVGEQAVANADQNGIAPAAAPQAKQALSDIPTLSTAATPAATPADPVTPPVDFRDDSAELTHGNIFTAGGAPGMADYTFFSQPVMNTATNSVDHYELLLRVWDSKQGGWHLPASFGIPASMEAHLMARAVAQLDVKNVSINFTPAQFLDDDTQKALTSLAQSKDVGHVTVELGTVPDATVAASAKTYQDAGITVTLDNLGNQGSTTEVAPVADQVDNLKVSLRGMRQNGDDLTQITKNLAAWQKVAQAHGNLLEVEGLETADELAVTNALGITHVQGYYFSRPAMPGTRADLM